MGDPADLCQGQGTVVSSQQGEGDQAVGVTGVARLMPSQIWKATFSSWVLPSPASASAWRSEKGSPNWTQALPLLLSWPRT